MPNENSAVESFECTTVGYQGRYVYKGGRKFADRYSHNPWVWSNEDNASAPHLTMYENDMPQGEVTSFHLSYPYDGQAHKIVHVYFAIKNGVVQFSSVDANRCGDVDKVKARQAAINQKMVLTQLATALVNGALPA
jgi:hypothetical protein